MVDGQLCATVLGVINAGITRLLHSLSEVAEEEEDNGGQIGDDNLPCWPICLCGLGAQWLGGAGESASDGWRKDSLACRLSAGGGTGGRGIGPRIVGKTGMRDK